MKTKRNYLLEATLTTGVLFLLILFLRAILSKVQRRASLKTDAANKLRITNETELKADMIPPVTLGTKRVVLQFSTFLPQIHLTLISVLEGLALGVLINQFAEFLGEVLSNISPSTILPTFLTNLPELLRFIDSLVIIVLIWYLYSSVFVTFLWPLSGWHTLLQFLLATVQSLTYFYISQPAGWTLGCAITAVLGAVIRYYNTRIVGPFSYDDEEIYQKDMSSEKSAARRFLLTGAIFGALGVLQLYWPSQSLALIVAAAALITLLSMCWKSERTDRILIEMHLKGSRWAFWKRQVVNRDALSKDSEKDREAA